MRPPLTKHVRGPAQGPLLGPAGSCARVTLSWTVAGGIAAGGIGVSLLTLAGSVTVLTSLDFLGFGLPPGSPSLGEILAQGKANLQAPWLGVTGFVIIGLMLSLLIFIGEGVRDAFDPKLRRR